MHKGLKIYWVWVAWVAQSVGLLGYDLRVVRSMPKLGSVLSRESAALYLLLSLPLPHTCFLLRFLIKNK